MLQRNITGGMLCSTSLTQDTDAMDTEPGKALLEPAQKLNQLAAANVEKLTKLQIESLRRYSQVGIDQFNAAGEVHDFKSLQSFMGKQSGFLKALGECVLADTKALVQLGVGWLSKAKQVSQEKTPAGVSETGEAKTV